MKNVNAELQKEEEKRRVERVLAILLEADLICFGKLLEQKNGSKKKKAGRKTLTKPDKDL